MARIPTVPMSELPSASMQGGMRPVQRSVGSQRQAVTRSMGTPTQAVRLSAGTPKRAGRRGVALVEGVRLSESALNAGNRGTMALGEAIGYAAQQAGQIAINMSLRQQDLQDKGRLASEDSRRLEVEAGITKYVMENPDRPETWAQVRNESLKQYEKDRAARRQKEGWGARVTEIDEINYGQFKTRVETQGGVDDTKGIIRKANGQLKANADAKLRAGDYAGFMAAMDTMVLFPDQREAMIREGLEEGMYKTANNELDALRELPPAAAIPQYKQFLAELGAKDEKTGRYLKYEFPRGGLSLGGRVNMESIANARIREAEHAMNSNGRQIVTEIRAGRATAAQVSEALSAGMIDRDTAELLAPDVLLAQEVADERIAAKQQVKLDKLEREAQAKAAKLDTLSKKALEAGEIGVREIERQVALGEIDPAQGNELIARLGVASQREQMSEESDYQIISGQIHSAFANKLLMEEEPDPEVYRKIHAEITLAELTKESRLKLVGEFLDMKLTDIANLEEEGPQEGTWGNRKISPPEREMRATMIGEYKKLLPALGDQLAGSLLFNQEAKIRQFFDSADKPRTKQETDKFFKEELMPEAQKAAGFEALRDAFQF
jgi:hypothetical protein